MVIHDGIGISRRSSFDGLLEFLVSEVIKEFIIEVSTRGKAIMDALRKFKRSSKRHPESNFSFSSALQTFQVHPASVELAGYKL